MHRNGDPGSSRPWGGRRGEASWENPDRRTFRVPGEPFLHIVSLPVGSGRVTPSTRARVAPRPAADVVALHHHHGTPRGGRTAASKAGDNPDAAAGQGRRGPAGSSCRRSPGRTSSAGRHSVPRRAHASSFLGRQVAAAGGVTGLSHERTADPRPGLLLHRPLRPCPAWSGVSRICPHTLCAEWFLSSVLPSLSCCLIRVSFGVVAKVDLVACVKCQLWGLGTVHSKQACGAVWWVAKAAWWQVGWRQRRGCFSG